MTPHYSWTPASEPPDTSRKVLIWWENMGKTDFSMHTYSEKSPFAFYVTHWRDVEPPGRN